jgi:glycosyltransferase involved in cell wall biosynthesis
MKGGGGEEIFVRDLASHPPSGVRYSLVMDHHESIAGARARRSLEIGFNRLVQPWLWPLSGLRAYKLEDGCFDLVHVHNYVHHISSSRFVPVVMSLGGGSYYHYIREYLGWPETRIDRLYRRAGRVYRSLRLMNEFVTWHRLSGILVRSNFARSFLLSRGVPASLVDVIPPGFDTPILPARPRETDSFTFLLLGRDPARKGADLAIEAFRRLRSSGRDARLILVGHASWLSLAEEPGLEVHDWTDRQRLYREFYPRADALLMPSRVEGFGLAAIEAMSFALPVIATRCGAFPETIDDGRTGLLVPPGDAEGLMKAMERVSGDVPGAREMGMLGRVRFLQKYTRERFLTDLSGFYDRALSR